jgi:hypothetical protein
MMTPSCRNDENAIFDDTGGASNDANNTLKRDNLNVHSIRLVAGHIAKRRNGSDGVEIPSIVAKSYPE